MRVLVTGATGFIGSHLVPELIASGHQVVGLSRSEAGAETLGRAGAEAIRGDVNDLDSLRAIAATVDSVIHAAFNHDFSTLKENSENDRKVIATLGEVLAGSERTLIVTSGTGLARSEGGEPARETDAPVSSADFPRAATEEAADDLIATGGRVIVIRLPQVHDTRRQGRISWHIETAVRQGRAAYVGAGDNRVAAAHVSDVVRLYRLALEKGQPGARYHAVDEEGVTLRDIAEAVGTRLALPVVSLMAEEAAAYFGWLAPLAMADMPAYGALTRRELGWTPVGPSLVSDLLRLQRAAAD
jgi:nucleoside-diphosphate-sugar epimerase